MRNFRSRKGMASALIIMLLVLLIFFGVLSLVTTAADLRLSQKRADWNQQYYLADALAVSLLAEIESLEVGDLQQTLENLLAENANVRDHRVVAGTSADAPLTVAARIAAQADQGQGIEFQLRISIGSPGQKAIQVEVLTWTQWQPEFDYEGSNGGIWKG